jgi:hypothetical protein
LKECNENEEDVYVIGDKNSSIKNNFIFYGRDSDHLRYKENSDNIDISPQIIDEFKLQIGYISNTAVTGGIST